MVVTDASVPQPGWYGAYQKPDLDFGHHVFHDKTHDYTFAEARIIPSPMPATLGLLCTAGACAACAEL